MDKQKSQRLREAMNIACTRGDFEKVFKLIRAGQDPRHALPGSLMPLHYAAFHGNLEMVRKLVEEHGCKPGIVDKNDYTPLHYACYGGHQDIVRYLISRQKCDPHIESYVGNLPLHCACFHEVLDASNISQYCSLHLNEPTNDHFEVAKFLLTEGGCNVTGSHKCAPPLVVHLACRYGTVAFVQFLIEEKSCDPNSQNKDKETPVHVASKYGNVEILRYLVEVKGCSLIQQNKDENTSLHLACMFQHLETVQYLVKKQQNLTMLSNGNKALPIHIACCKDSLEIVKLVTSQGSDKFNYAKDNNGRTPLHIASAYGSLEVVKWLIEELHCDPNIKDDNLSTPLHYACGRAYVEYDYNEENGINMQVAEYLVVSCGCDPMKNKLMQIACQEDLKLVKLLTSSNVNCVDEYGNTPLHLACTENKIEVVEFLILERHCRQDIQNDRGELPLHIACSQQSYKWLQTPTNQLELVILVSSDCDINVTTKDGGDTPVHIACRHSQISTVTYLTKKHCHLNIANSEGELPLHIACQQNSLEMVKLVSSCDLHAQTRRGFTAMHMACMIDAMEIVEYLVQEKHWELKPKLYDDLFIHCACAKGSAELVRKLANLTNVNLKFPNMECHDSTSENDSDNVPFHFDGIIPKDEFYGAFGNMPLHEACKCENVEVIKVLVEEFHCDKAVRNAEGELPLHLACREQSLEVVELVSSIYDATIQNNAGDTPLHIACKNGQMDFVKYLTEKCVCNPTIQNRSRELAVHYACQHSLEMVKLVSDCESVESRTLDGGLTPLHIACLHGKLDIVRYLIDAKKCSPDVDSSDGLTLLDYACGKTGFHFEFRAYSRQDNEATKAALVNYLINKCDYDPPNVLSLFVKACKESNLEVAKLLCRNTDIVNSSDAEGNTPLHIACMYQQMELVKFLIEERKCDQQVTNRAGNLPLHIACECDSLLEVVELVSNCDINAQTELGNTPLHIACRHNNVELVQFLTEECQCDQNIPNKDGELPLHIACSQRSLKLVKLVSNCDFSAPTAFGDTPLHIACRHNAIELVQFLSKRCQCDQTNNIGELPLHIACSQRSLKMVELVSDCKVNTQTINKETPLQLACRYHHVDIAHYLVHSKGADPSILDESGQNLLHKACMSGDLPLVKILAASTTVNSRDENGNTPLHIACNNKHFDIAKFLIEEAPTKTDPSIQNHSGNLALHIACGKHSLALTKLVSNCDPNVKNSAGNTPLHVACEECVKYIVEESCDFIVENEYMEILLLVACRESNTSTVKYLLEVLHCDPNIQNRNGELPLHVACTQASLEIVKLVSNCEPSIQTSSGDTALHLACSSQTEIFQKVSYLLEKACCNPDIQNINGETPLHIACHDDNLQTVKLIGEFVQNPNLVTLSGDTPLHIACKSIKSLQSAKNIVRYLISKTNCNQKIANNKSELPLHLACKRSAELVKLVSNCNINSQTVTGDTPLHIACKENKIKIIKYLTKTKQCDANIQNQKGELPLHIACARGDLEMAKLVCECNMNAVTTTGDTPLHLALSCSFRENLVKFLISKGHCDLTLQNDEGKLPLHIACERHFVEIVQLVKNCDVNARTKLGDTPLHTVCKRTTRSDFVVGFVKCLVRERHCNLTIQNNDKELPLHIACEKHSIEVIRLVGECDVNAKTSSGDTPLHIVCRKERYTYMYYGENFTAKVWEVVKYLAKERHCDLTIQNNEGELPLHIACQNCSLDVVKLVSECDVELQTVSGDTPLHIACQRGNPDIVEYLIKVRHCNPGAYNCNNELPLHIACKMHMRTDLEIVKLLCDCDVNTQTLKSGDTPLHYACMSNYYEVVKYLVEEKLANPTIQNSNGQLPLHIACTNISFKLVELLSNCDADFNCKTHTGDTPLHEACKVYTYYSGDKKKVIQFLVEKEHCDLNGQNNAGMTPLHHACKLNARDIVLYLLSTGKVGPSVTTKNSDGQTPVMLTDDIEIIRELLKHGADSHPLYQKYEKFFKECSSETPPPTPFSILVLGNASTGKTTLIESLKEEEKLVVQDTSPDAHTAGIIPNPFESKEYGLVTFYDFAGQHEYYASHEAVTRTIARSTPPAIILVVNISESEENIKREVLYWLSFIRNWFPTVTSKPHLIITGSHADVVVYHGGNPHTKMESLIVSIKSQLAKSPAKFVAFTTMDCRVSESPGIKSLRHHMQNSSKKLKDHGVMNFMSHCFHIYLLEYFQHLPAVSLSQITSCLLQKQMSEYPTFSSYQSAATLEDNKPKRLLPTKPSEIDSILEELSEKGHIMFLKSSRRRSSWVVLNKEALLGDINGTVFASKRFKQYKNLASSTGVVPFSAIANHFPKHDPNMIVSFLSHLEFCHVIADEEALNLIEGNQTNSTTSSASSEPYFLFPHLVSIECPQHIWRADENFEYTCGWLLWCSEDHHFFTPRFLQVILLRLAFSFALDIQIRKHRDHPAIQRRCSIWKNGISWLNEDGIEVLVEVREQNQVVAVMMRCIGRSATKTKCTCLRSSVLQKILRTKEEFCFKVSATESFISPRDLQYPLKPPQDLTLFTLSDVAKSVVNTNPCVLCTDGSSLLELDKLLLFEPYNNLGENILKELFDEKKEDRKINDDFLYDIADQIVGETDSKDINQKKEYFLKLFSPLPTLLQERVCRAPEGTTHELVRIFKLWIDRSTDQSYGRLRRKLDEYSVFCGRNPLELVAVEEKRC